MRFTLALLFAVSLWLAACDFHGPWEYYPEEREVYTGIYTYGYVVEKQTPYVCFSKVYELDETSSQNFAFYDSASVTVQGHFYHAYGETNSEIDTTLQLEPDDGKPNCFTMWHQYVGMSGEKYTLNAYFEWDSAGHAAKSTYRAEATIPKPVKLKGVNAPQQDGGYKWIEYDSQQSLTLEFLEYPMDMEFVKFALEYDNSDRGVLTVMNYGMENDESVNTTINQMFKGMTEADSEGYRGIAMHDPLERQYNMGFTENNIVAGIRSLDTLYGTNMMLVLGYMSVDFYATDGAYVDYINKVKASVSDSRILPESNIENGMGVFSGMAKTRVNLYVDGVGVSLEHIAGANCDNTSDEYSDSWGSKGCRLYQDVACAGMSALDGYADLYRANEVAYTYYRDTVLNRDHEMCYASNVKAAMMLDTTSWALFLPDTINQVDKSNAYADGLKRYCVASNFESNHIADCSELYKDCIESAEKTNCKEYLWIWCADRNWNLEKYPQCKYGLVSRYYLEEQKSSVLEREVKAICGELDMPICKK